MAMLFGKKRRAADAELRRATRPSFESRGWRWEDAAPAPSIELQEAVLRMRRPGGRIWTVGMSELATGPTHGYDACAARIVGYEFVRTSGGTPLGRRAETNAVWLRLPSALPEIRFGDATLPRRDDYGIRLPVLPRMAAGPSERWSAEGFVPAFAADLLTPGFVAALEAAPERSSIVIRAGFAVCYGAPTLEIDVVDARLALLAALLAEVPQTAWGRADPLVAGTGVFPAYASDGARLSLDQRLVAPDWKGYGLQKVTWDQAPTAEATVPLRHGESGDTWVTPPVGSDGIAVGLKIGDVALTAAHAHHTIPTVAESLRAQS